jgi:hypothetical protein
LGCRHKYHAQSELLYSNPKEKERRDGRRKSNEEVENEIERETER